MIYIYIYIWRCIGFSFNFNSRRGKTNKNQSKPLLNPSKKTQNHKNQYSHTIPSWAREVASGRGPVWDSLRFFNFFWFLQRFYKGLHWFL